MQPVLETERLVLRPYRMADAPDVQRLAGAWEVAATTAAIPHPYPDGAAEQWIAGHASSFAEGRLVVYAVTMRETAELLGTVSLLDVQLNHARAELGYWIAREHWGKGYCTEAVRRLIQYAHDSLSISRIVARCLERNPASARVMKKVGLAKEGHMPKHEFKNGRFEDVLVYGMVLPGRGNA
jgi:ribosomal-protein-alanine N-acetyltransferase